MCYFGQGLLNRVCHDPNHFYKTLSLPSFSIIIVHSIFPPWSAKDELSLLSSVLEIANEPAESYNPRVNLFERIGRNLENYIQNRDVLDKVRELRRKFEENCCEIREVDDDDDDVFMSNAAFEISGKIWGDGGPIKKKKVMMKDEETGTPSVRKSRNWRSRDSVEEILAKWEEHNNITDTENSIQRTPAKGSRKGCMEGKGGPENSNCKYRGVRQRISGTWASEIREPNRGRQLWLGTFDTALGALAYDAAARKMYGPAARINFLESCSTGNGVSSTSGSYEPTTSSHRCNSIQESKELQNPNDEAGDITTACTPPSNTQEAGTVVLKDAPNTEGSLDQYVQFQDLPDYMFDVEDFTSVIDAYPACGTSREQDMTTFGHDQSGGVDEWQQYGGVDENTLFLSQNPEENMSGNLGENMTGKLWHHTDKGPDGGDHIRDATKDL